MTATLLTMAGAFVATTISAIVPWVNAEVIVVSLAAIASSRWQLASVVLIATGGQMAGKCVVYGMARRGARAPSERVARQNRSAAAYHRGSCSGGRGPAKRTWSQSPAAAASRRRRAA